MNLLHSYFLFAVMSCFLLTHPLFASDFTSNQLAFKQVHDASKQIDVYDQTGLYDQTDLYDQTSIYDPHESVMYAPDHTFHKIFRANGRHHLIDFLRLSLSKDKLPQSQIGQLAHLVILWQKIGLDFPGIVKEKILPKSQFIVSPAEIPPKVEA